MKKSLLAILSATALLLAACNTQQHPAKVLLTTTMGEIEVELCDATPLHRDNFLSLVEQHYFDSLLFHRVIENFMIQGGDPDSRHAEAGTFLGDGGPGYTIPAEFRFPDLYHHRGALAAAREGDAVNPEKASAGSQFYIVWGRTFTDEQLDQMQQRIENRVVFTPEIREVYKSLGGTPHLDGAYTVFGYVTRGLEVVEAIQKVATDQHDRPTDDVRILSAKRIE